MKKSIFTRNVIWCGGGRGKNLEQIVNFLLEGKFPNKL